MNKFDKMARFLPGLYKPYTNTNVRGLVKAWSSEDDILLEQIQAAKDQLFVLTAQLQYLDALGSNVGVFRPTAFNMSDALYRKLIPALSYHPKQIKPTITEVLDIFFGENNPEVSFAEINCNEIVIAIPSAVPSLRRTLKGSHHFHAYSGFISSIDNVSKQLTIDISEDSKLMQESELAGSYIGQGLNTVEIVDNTAGTTGIVLQFGAGADLSVFNLTDNFVLLNPHYPGAFFKHPAAPWSLRRRRGVLGQNISQGDILTTITMLDASDIPNEEGLLVFNFSQENEESEIRYLGRPNNSTLLIDPIYPFQKDHAIGEVVNLIVKPSTKPNIDGTDYGIYIVGVTAARILAQQIIQSIVASGVVIRWIVKEPVC